MVLFETVHDIATASAVTWASVEDGFHVASRDGEFLGYIDRQSDGRHLVCNMYSRPVGHFDDLPAAMDALVMANPLTGPTVR